MADSDDDRPLAAWAKVERPQAPKTRTDEDDEYDLPEWAQNFRSPFTGTVSKPVASNSSDEVVDLTGSGSAPKRAVSKELDKAQDGPSQAMCAAADSQPNLQPLQAELQGGAEDEHSDKPTHLVQGPGQGGGKDAELKPIGVVQQQLALGQGEVALMLPERVPRNKALLELAAGDNEMVVDLAGDSGAVGRLLVTGKQGSEELQVDLKGVLFSASVLPLAGTAMVVNITSTEAKVEAVLNDFVRLTEQRGLWAEDEGGGVLAGLSDDDDERYGVQGDNQGDDEDGGGKSKSKGKSKKKAEEGTAGKGKTRKKADEGKGAKPSKGRATGKGAGGRGAGGKLGAKGGVAKKKALSKPSKVAASDKGGGKGGGKTTAARKKDK